MNEFEIIDYKIWEMEEILGRKITADENLKLLSDFYGKFKRLADELGIKSTDIFENVQLTAELDELIDYDFDMAKSHALEAL